jgi:hypothetical protein
MVHEKSTKATNLCGLWAGVLFKPYFYEYGARNTVTVNGMNMNGMWFNMKG